MILVTWNMQGANFKEEDKWQNGVNNFFTAEAADVVCLQECGVVPSSATQIWASTRYPGMALYSWGTDRTKKYILFHSWDTLGGRVNTAIVMRNRPRPRHILAPQGVPRVSRLYFDSRPAIGVRIGMISYYSIHAISPNGPDVTQLLEAIYNGVVVVAGDYNRAPGHIHHWNNWPPDSFTHSTRDPSPKSRYDYCYSNFATIQGTVLSLVQSDHYPVKYKIPP